MIILLFKCKQIQYINKLKKKTIRRDGTYFTIIIEVIDLYLGISLRSLCNRQISYERAHWIEQWTMKIIRVDANNNIYVHIYFAYYLVVKTNIMCGISSSSSKIHLDMHLCALFYIRKKAFTFNAHARAVEQICTLTSDELGDIRCRRADLMLRRRRYTYPLNRTQKNNLCPV